jgi:hypothetical protein
MVHYLRRAIKARSSKERFQRIMATFISEMERQYSSPKMVAARKQLARELLGSSPKGSAPQDVLCFFENVGRVVHAADYYKEISNDTFGYFASRWWAACENYIAEERRKRLDNFLFSYFEHLATEVVRYRTKPIDSEIERFLEIERDL